jgi:hypothetical protein
MYHHAPVRMTVTTKSKKKKIARYWWLTPVNLATVGGRDEKDCSLRPAQAKKLPRPHLNQ